VKMDRNWTVLFIGGASGIGKSRVAYELASIYGVNVMEADDVCQAIKAMTIREYFPAIHYWETGVDWKDIGIESNVDWLISVSKEIVPALKAIAENHLESNMPVIIEGDFVDPEFAMSFNSPKVQSLVILESDQNQIVQNLLSREGGDLQQFRADISVRYGERLSSMCEKLGIPVIESKPWETVIDRIIANVT